MEPQVSDVDVLGLALGAPARQVLNHAQCNGPKSGWKDGYLSTEYGLCPPDPDQAYTCLRRSLGNIWLQVCARLPALTPRSKVRQSITALPVVSATSDTVPDQALWAASTCLNVLAAAFRYEARRDGNHSVSTGEADLELPRALSLPLEQVSKRLRRPHQQISPYDVSICNYRPRHGSSPSGGDDLMLLFPIFDNAEEAQSLLWMAKLQIAFSPAINLIAQCQEKMLHQDSDALTLTLMALTKIVNTLVPILRDLPAEALSTYRKCAATCAPDGHDSTPYPELNLPVFQLMDAFVGMKARKSSGDAQTTSQRLSLPVNIRAFAAAIESRPVGDFVQGSMHTQLRYAWNALGQAYCGSDGLLGIYEQKSIASQHLAARTGQLTHFRTADSHDECPLWEDGDRNIAKGSSVDAFEHCVVRAKVTARSRIDGDHERTTALVSLLVEPPHGLSFEPGDRLLAMPLNSWTEVEKIAAALGLDSYLDSEVPLYGDAHWDKFSRQLHPKRRQEASTLSVQDVLRYGQIAPLTKAQLATLNKMFHGTCSLVTQLLKSTTWPVRGTLGDVLQIAIEQVSPVIWDTVFDLSRLSWLPDMIPVAGPRAYGISNPALMGTSLPSTIKITVTRASYEVDPQLDAELEDTGRFGMTSHALNPRPEETGGQGDDNGYPFLIGVAPASNLRLQSTPMDNVVMFADANSVGIFRSFWRSRSSSVGKSLLFLALQTATKYPFEAELKQLESYGQIQVFTSLAAETDPLDKARLLSSAILDQGQHVCDLLTSTSQGGLGAHFYLSGSMKLYQSVIAGVRRALYNSDFVLAGKSADDLIASAANEGRLMLDIYSEPSRPIEMSRQISLAQLATRTGHRTSMKLWHAVSGSVYDLTTMQKLWPAETLPLRLNAGLDASKELSMLVTSNPALRNLLPDLLIGRLKERPSFSSADNQNLFELWASYLRSAIETLTALAYETEVLLRGGGEWFTTATGRESLRTFLQVHTRLFRSGVSSMFGVILQELHVRTAFAHVSKSRPDARIPDVMGIVARARSSQCVATAVKELHVLGDLSRSSRLTQVQASTATQYIQAVTELELHLLESVRDDVRGGIEALEQSPDIDEHVTSSLLAILEHVAYRYQAFWERLSLESVGRSCMRKTLLRKKHDIVQRPLQAGGVASAVIVSPANMLKPTSPLAQMHFVDHTVNFAHLVDQAMQTVNEENLMAAYADIRNRGQSSRNDHAISPSATHAPTEPTAYDSFHRRRAVRALASFLGTSEPAIKRLSQLPADLSFAYIMATYGRSATNMGSHTRSSSAARSVLRTMDSQAGHDTPRPRLIRRRTNHSSVSSPTPQSIFSSPEAATPDTRASTTTSPMPLQLTLRSRERSASKPSAPSTRQIKAQHTGVPIQAPPAMFRSSSSRQQSVSVPAVALVSALTSEGAAELAPSTGAKLPALLPSPRLPEGDTIAEKPEQSRYWEMPLVSLSKFQRQAANSGIPRPAVPLQTMRQPPAAPVLSVTSAVEHGQPGQQSVRPVLKRSFSGKELPIVTLSRNGKVVGQQAVTVSEKQYWEMPLYTLSASELQSSTTTNGPRVPAVPLQTIRHAPAAPALPMHLPVKDERPVLKRSFSGRELPIVTLSRNSARVSKQATKAPPKQLWEMPLYTLSMSELQTSSTTSNESRLPAVPLQKVHRAPAAPALPMPSSGSATHVRPVPKRSFSGKELPVVTLSKNRGRVGQQPAKASRKQCWEMPLYTLSTSELRTSSKTSDGTRLPAVPLQKVTQLRAANVTPQTAVLGSARPVRAVVSFNARQLPIFTLSKSEKKRGNVGTRKGMKTTAFAVSKKSLEPPKLATRLPPSRGLWQFTDEPHMQDRVVFGNTRTLGYVGMWMRPASKINNNDFLGYLRETAGSISTGRHGQKLNTRHPPLAQGRLWDSTVLKAIARPGKTQGYVGLWMNPPSKKQNEDFELVLRGKKVPSPMLPIAKPMGSKAVCSGAAPSSLWQKGSDTETSRSGRTAGYVGMWMKPASRIRNSDFEKARADTKSLGSSPSRKAPASSKPLPSFHVSQLWSKDTDESTAEAFSQTLGSVGMWMLPASQKVNIDFEQLLANTVNFLLGSTSGLHERMANDMQLIATELHHGPWVLTDWTALSQSKRAHQLVALPTEGRAPVQSRRAAKPDSYLHQTLGQVGMWMYPPSKKRNFDFEGFRAATEAAPELEFQPTPREGRRNKQISHPKIRKSAVSVRTRGFVGLWMDPPSCILNADFEQARDRMELSPETQPVNSLVEASSTSTTRTLVDQEPVLIIQHPEQRERASYAFLAESPTLPTSHTATMTPTSASTTDGLARHNIDFEERLKKLNAELDIAMDDDSAMNTPVLSVTQQLPSVKMNLPITEDITQSPGSGRWGAPNVQESSAQPAVPRRPQLESIKTDAPRLLNQDGLELLSATRYTPESASSGSSVTLLSPASAARPVRPARPVQHLWEREIGPTPAELPPAPLRTQSTKQPAVSRVNSVKNMWEKRASLVMEAPKLSRSGSRSPPEPLKLQRANTSFHGTQSRRRDNRDSATIPGFEYEANSSSMSPMSPSVRAY